mmetsp:Transcript_52976/g.124101  ORF Transcript_52976/g.124101 Transcript_52976/m.124101 type:complete len:219 (+) Transcript_52976:237-893(+)
MPSGAMAAMARRTLGGGRRRRVVGTRRATHVTIHFHVSGTAHTSEATPNSPRKAQTGMRASARGRRVQRRSARACVTRPPSSCPSSHSRSPLCVIRATHMPPASSTDHGSSRRWLTRSETQSCSTSSPRLTPDLGRPLARRCPSLVACRPTPEVRSACKALRRWGETRGRGDPWPASAGTCASPRPPRQQRRSPRRSLSRQYRLRSASSGERRAARSA